MALETLSIVDQLRLELQRQILNGIIGPEMPLTEQSVADMFSVARPTAKAAIGDLVNLGLLLRRPHHKIASVPRFTEADVADIYENRALIENEVVKRLAERGDVPWDAVEALRRFRVLIGDADQILELVKYDMDFHRALTAATGSPRLRRFHESVIREAQLCMVQVQMHSLLDPNTIAKEHDGILKMIEATKPNEAIREMSEHISRARNGLLSHINKLASRRAPDA